jgi:hypothetical protein
MARKPSIFIFPDHVENEIIKYLGTHCPVDCTISKMARKGGLRPNVSRPYNFLKKKIVGLVEKQVIYPIKVEDPVRKTSSTYYTLIPTDCPKLGEVGIPKWVLKNESKCFKVLKSFYTELSYRHYSIEARFCELCKKWSSIFGKEILGCGPFFNLYRAVTTGDYSQISEEDGLYLNNNKKLEIHKCFIDWSKQETISSSSSVLFLEDLICAMVGFVISQAVWYPDCENCRNKKKCLDEGYTWSKKTLEPIINNLPENDLKKFWQILIAGKPVIDYMLLYKYFSQRFQIKEDKEDNPFMFLRSYENALPYFYSKLLPLSFGFLVRYIVVPIAEACNLRVKKVTKKWK